ncbi:hypothetical protein [Pseudofrankia asymbiotica]|uniref:Reverse transcriptase domain-containing protein n=1 Tax=Pseudofrankia asymbiotica TaxID=1834516 RepID=A0A1V2IIR1_9ACTN|nr:hypothetical protein [Pseudofrankia asymbiotica]ONH32870.1 hypothetical protein BL253_03945 [Pseudofrankia asymbiotica]
MDSGERHHAESPREEVAGMLAPLGLRLSPEKTRVVHIDEGFDFLGFHNHILRRWASYFRSEVSKLAVTDAFFDELLGEPK